MIDLKTRESGVAEERIIPETEATSTYENAVITLSMMEEHGFSSAIVVYSDYHMLRTVNSFIGDEAGEDL